MSFEKYRKEKSRSLGPPGCRTVGCTNPIEGQVRVSLFSKEPNRAVQQLATKSQGYCEEHTAEVYEKMVLILNERQRR